MFQKKNRQITSTCMMILFLMSSRLMASKNSDFQSWNTFNFTKELNKSYSILNEIHLRFSHDASKLSQTLIRPSINYHIDKVNSIAAGYTWIYNFTPQATRNFNVHDLWQQYQLITKFNDLELNSRSRLEEQFIQRNSKTRWRYRQLFNIIKPINSNIIDFISVSNEFFLLLNDSSNTSNNRGYTENRLYIGIGQKLNKDDLLQIGYQYQHIRRFKQSNLNANTVVFILNARLL